MELDGTVTLRTEAGPRPPSSSSWSRWCSGRRSRSSIAPQPWPGSRWRVHIGPAGADRAGPRAPVGRARDRSWSHPAVTLRRPRVARTRFIRGRNWQCHNGLRSGQPVVGRSRGEPPGHRRAGTEARPGRRGTGRELGCRRACGSPARQPRFGVDVDERTIPNELPWLESAVHLDKGCYRGQETVARVNNLGLPPRRLVMLHLDGTADTLPSPGDPVLTAAGSASRTGRHRGPALGGRTDRAGPGETVDPTGNPTAGRRRRRRHRPGRRGRRGHPPALGGPLRPS